MSVFILAIICGFIIVRLGPPFVLVASDPTVMYREQIFRIARSERAACGRF